MAKPEYIGQDANGGLGDGMHEMMNRGGLAHVEDVFGATVWICWDGSIWIQEQEMVGTAYGVSLLEDGDRDA